MVFDPTFCVETCNLFYFTQILDANIVIFLSENARIFRFGNLRHVISMFQLSCTVHARCWLRLNGLKWSQTAEVSSDPGRLLEVGINKIV